jgi:hypothetical protein
MRKEIQMAKAPAQSPAWWLPALTDRLGPPEIDTDLTRWTWQDGELGVFIDRLTHAWQTVAWAPRRSVTLRSIEQPSDADIERTVRLAGLLDVTPSTGS